MISVPDPITTVATETAPSSAVIGLAEATDTAIAGRKAAGLARLLGHGLRVPGGFVVTGTADLSSREVIDAIAAQLAGLAGAVAVRSSSTVEDLSDASFAGMYETVLGVDGIDAVVAAIEMVRASGRSDRVSAYHHEEAATPSPEMAVLVQRMVPAEAAGVAFGADPLTGDRTATIVSAVAGLGDRLVSGEAASEDWAVGPSGARLRREAVGAIDAVAALQVSDLVRQIEAIDGAPVDIEWAIAGGTVFLLQARPMTALPDVVSWDPGLPGAWLRGFRLGEWLGGPVTPLFESWGLTRIERAMDRTIGGLIGMDPPQPGHVVVNGWYYYGGLNLVPTSAVAGLGQLVRHIIPSFIVRPRKAVMAFPRLAGLGVRQAEREWRTEILPGYRALVERSRAEVETAEPSDLAALVDRLADAAGRYFGYVTQVAGYSSKAEVPLARFYGANLRPRIGGSHLDLLVALGQRPQGIAPHALRSLDWSEPTLGESGSAFDEGAARHRHEQAADRRRAAEAAARDALAIDAKLRARFDRLLATAQHYALVREEQIGDFSLAWPVMQRAIARLAEHLVERGVLSDPDQVHFLEREEIDAALGPDALPLDARCEERRTTWRRQSRLAAPLTLGRLPKMIARVVDEATEAIRGSLGDPGDAIVGIPASPGRATGPVRIIRGVAEFHRVQPGDILVCPVTAPAWTALFGTVAAVVTDTGGVAAHASIVAREYGLPAVVGTGDATWRLRDGDLVEVDGSTGVVRSAGT